MNTANPTHTLPTGDIVSLVRGMRRRETQYMPQNYFNQIDMSSSSSSESFNPGYSMPLDYECRLKMSLWCSQIVAHCRFSQETCAIAMNSLDRFLSVSPWACQDRSAFQLAAISSLYTTIKVHEPQAIAAKSMADLTRNVYTSHQIEAMERCMLETNKWLIHPPTTFAYASLFCELVSGADSRFDCQMLSDLAKLQLESSIHNFEIALTPPSEVAFAAVMNAVEGMAVCSPHTLGDFENLLASVAEINSSSPSIRLAEKILYESLIGGGNMAPAPSSHPSCGQRNNGSMHKGCGLAHGSTSPRSVSAVKAHQ